MPFNQNTNEIVELQAKSNSEKRSRFVTMASKRTSNVLNDMNILQRCFDEGSYEYTQEQVTKILGALETKITDLRSAAERGSSRQQFTL